MWNKSLAKRLRDSRGEKTLQNIKSKKKKRRMLDLLIHSALKQMRHSFLFFLSLLHANKHFEQQSDFQPPGLNWPAHFHNLLTVWFGGRGLTLKDTSRSGSNSSTCMHTWSTHTHTRRLAGGWARRLILWRPLHPKQIPCKHSSVPFNGTSGTCHNFM